MAVQSTTKLTDVYRVFLPIKVCFMYGVYQNTTIFSVYEICVKNVDFFNALSLLPLKAN
jgi:hypothetical protein